MSAGELFKLQSWNSACVKPLLRGGNYQDLSDVDEIGGLQTVGLGDHSELRAGAIVPVGDVPQAVAAYHGVGGLAAIAVSGLGRLCGGAGLCRLSGLGRLLGRGLGLGQSDAALRLYA